VNIFLPNNLYSGVVRIIAKLLKIHDWKFVPLSLYYLVCLVLVAVVHHITHLRRLQGIHWRHPPPRHYSQPLMFSVSSSSSSSLGYLPMSESRRPAFSPICLSCPSFSFLVFLCLLALHHRSLRDNAIFRMMTEQKICQDYKIVHHQGAKGLRRVVFVRFRYYLPRGYRHWSHVLDPLRMVDLQVRTGVNGHCSEWPTGVYVLSV